MYNYYYPDGEKIEGADAQAKFISFYNLCYFYSNSKLAEDKIDGILMKQQLDKNDVMFILRWKFNRISHQKCTEDIIFKEKDYTDSDRNVLKPFITSNGRGKEVDAKEICKYIECHYKNKNTEIYDVYNSLAKKAPSNMGPVCLLTLVSFITRGEYPVYDLYALQAVNAIKLITIKPRDRVSVGKLIQNENKQNTQKIIELYENYKKSIAEIFIASQYNSRTIDRALWAYGHLFWNN